MYMLAVFLTSSILVGLVQSASNSATHQESGTIVYPFRLYGTAKYANGTAVDGASAYLVDSLSASRNTTITAGNYQFTGLSRILTYSLQINVAGHYPINDAINPPASGDLQHNVTLAPILSVVPIPPDGQCYHGAFCASSGASPTTNQMRNDINRFCSQANIAKPLAISEHGGTASINEDWFQLRPGDQSYMGTLYDEGLFKALIISMNPCRRSSTTTAAATADENDLAAGQYDSWLLSLANRCKNFKNASGQLYPLMIKIGVEVNAWNWAPYGASPTAFIGAFRYIVNYFRSQGVTNVVWLWNVNWNAYGYNPTYPISAYYPGDDVVDWLTVDAYRWGVNDHFYNQITEFYNFAKPKGKPMGVGEWGLRMSVTTDAQGVTYINDFFDTLEGKNGQTAHPEFKYIRYHWSQDSGGNRFTIQADNPSGSDYYPLSVAQYRTRIADPRYLTGLTS